MNGNSIKDFMSDITLWSLDLTNIEGFYEQVMKNIDIIKGNGSLL